MPRHACLVLTFIALLIAGANCLKNVKLELIPETVEHGQEVVLRCSYDLEGVLLYSLKWFRGIYEFYRYIPSQKPTTKIFNFTWIEVNPRRSNESQVTIQNVEFILNGNFSCEVTTDMPSFFTSSSHKRLTVVSVPKGKPVIVSERGRYEPGDTLKANCSTPLSKPAANHTFTLNDFQVGYEVAKRIPRRRLEHNGVGSRDEYEVDSELQTTEITVHLQPFHYLANGQLNLRCTAQVLDVYKQSSEVQLGSNLREPVPERVTSESGDGHRVGRLGLLGPLLLHLLFR